MAHTSLFVPAFALAGSLFLQGGEPAQAAPGKLPWYWFLETPPMYLDAGPGPRGNLTPKPVAVRKLRSGGAATVEVWGEDHQETLRLLKTRLNPELTTAYEVGQGSSIGTQVLSQIMAMGADFHPPAVAQVWYNCYQPLQPDPVQVRIGRPFANVTVSASSRR